MVEEINENGTGQVIVLAAAHVDGAFKADLAVFAETMAGIELLMGTLQQNNHWRASRRPIVQYFVRVTW